MGNKEIHWNLWRFGYQNFVSKVIGGFGYQNSEPWRFSIKPYRNLWRFACVGDNLQSWKYGYNWREWTSSEVKISCCRALEGNSKDVGSLLATLKHDNWGWEKSDIMASTLGWRRKGGKYFLSSVFEYKKKKASATEDRFHTEGLPGLVTGIDFLRWKSTSSGCFQVKSFSFALIG